MFKFFKKTDYRHYICIIITLGFIACSVFIFPNALGRVIESLRDFGISVIYYFCQIFGIDCNINPTVNSLPKTPFFDFYHGSAPTTSIPETYIGFKNKWSEYWCIWASKINFLTYVVFLGNLLYYLNYFLLTVIPLYLLFLLLFKRFLKKENNNYNKDSKPLKIFKKISLHTYAPVKKIINDFIDFVKNSKYIKIWFIIWIWNFNVISIITEAIAFYYYFVVSFDFINIYKQVYKLFLDLSAVIKFIPLWCWLLIALIVFLKIRKNIAYKALNRFEMRNRGFINERPIVFMVCGTMGKKKTTAITDMALSQEVLFRDKAFEKILENDMKFPYFPWINLENEIKESMRNHSVYNLATCRNFVKSKRMKFEKRKVKQNCFGYDFKRYGMTYNNKLEVINLWKVVETYTQLYFIYIIQSSLIISNYAIRSDNELSDLGNFPMWNTDFFKKDSRYMESYSRHSHILDFDSLRLGRKVLENNKNSDSFEFGVVVITEIGKERGNNQENKGKKKSDEETNQMNDLFNNWLKMARHSATVDNFPFVKVITDEQRPESWGADARDLCEIVHIKDSGETRLVLPFFSLEELLYGLVFNKFIDLYYQYRYVRSDNTLTMYLLKMFASKVQHYYSGIYNLFGYCILGVQVESGTQDGEISDKRYYLSNKKIYSKRFSTDCFSDFFMKKSLRSPVGINDLEEYKTEKATFDELEKQNSYFIGDLITGFYNEDSED